MADKLQFDPTPNSSMVSFDMQSTKYIGVSSG